MIKRGVKKIIAIISECIFTLSFYPTFAIIPTAINPLIDTCYKIMLYLCEDDNIGEIIVLINRLIIVQLIENILLSPLKRNT